MALLTKEFLLSKASEASGYLAESNIRTFSATSLANEHRSASRSERFDIFLSHSMEDAIYVKALRDQLTAAGFKVYVDWIDDPQLSRAHVTHDTANALRSRMRQCRSLLFATSESSRSSIWMPWELGFMDAFTQSRVAIVPIVESAEANSEFHGQEYLGLYPYLDKTGSNFYIHRTVNSYAGFDRWLNGADL